MEQVYLEQKTENKRRNRGASAIKNYSELYQKGWDIFTMLGESKVLKDLASKKDNLRDVIIKTLNDNDYNESNINEKLFSNYQGLPFNTFSELVDVIEDGYEANFDINNDSVLEIIDKFVPSIKNYMRVLANKSERFDVKDLISLTQHKRINQNKISKNQLLDEEKLKKERLVLSNNVVPYQIENKKTNEKENYFDFASVQFHNYKNDLLLPIKNYYSNELALKEDEQTFEKYNDFINNLKQRRYKFKTFEKRYPEADDVLVEGKRIYVAKQKDTQTENAIYLMYKLNKEELNKKSFGLFDRSYKKATKLFSSTTNRYEDEKFNFYRDFKRNKFEFNQYKGTLNEVIANLVTVNSARIYMEGTTFNKVAEHLELMASMQLATLPTGNYSWMLPYISEKVLELSKKNYEEAGITNFAQLKSIYEKTGRKVDDANTIDELIFSRVDYSFEANANRTNSKSNEKFNSEENLADIDLENDEYIYNLNKTQPLYKMYKEQLKEAIKMQPEAEDQVKAAAEEQINKQEKPADKQNTQEEKPADKQNTQEEKPADKQNTQEEQKQEETAEQEQKQEDECEKKYETNNSSFVKTVLKKFLKENIIEKSKENLSTTPAIVKNSEYIMNLRKSGVDLKKVVDVVYNEISKDIDENEQNYKTEEGKFYQLGALVFKSYFKGENSKLTPRTDFKKMLQETVKQVEKNNFDEATV